MSKETIIPSAFLLISSVGMYFYWVKAHTFTWKTVRALVLPALSWFIGNGIGDYLKLDLIIRVPIEICVLFAVWILLLNSWRYFESLGQGKRINFE